MIASDVSLMLKVNSILISQPEPESGKSPYFDLGDKYSIKVDFRQFIHVEGIPAKEFRKDRINPTDYSAVIFNSRNAIDHFFRICEEMKIRMTQETKYICISESIALYLQKYTQYRKRKVFYGPGREDGLRKLILKHKKGEKFLWPCADIVHKDLPSFLEENGVDFDMAKIYRTVSSDLSDLEKITYDVIIFFSPLGLKSLFENFPDFKQNDTRIAGFGTATCQAIEDAGLRLDIMAPVLPEFPSMTKALEGYIIEANK